MRAFVLALAGLTLGAAAPALPTAGQGESLREREALVAGAQKAWTGGRQAEAIAALEKALGLERRVFGPWHREVESSAGRLARLRQARGEWASEAEYRRAVLEARLRLDGEGHWRATDARLAVAEALAQPRRTGKQRDLLRRAAELGAQASGHHAKGEPARGIAAAREALAIRIEVLGERHPEVGGQLSDLAVLHFAAGEPKAALPLATRALAIRRETLGERHPRYASTLNNLAALREALGDHEAALAGYEEALAITRGVLGRDHPDYAGSLNNLAFLRCTLGDHAAALALYREALPIMKGAHGERSREYAAVLNNLGMLHEACGDYRAALPMYRRAVAIHKTASGVRHPSYATGLNNLAALHYLMGDYKAALPMFKEALAIRRAALGERHPAYAEGLNNLAMLHEAMGEDGAALPLYKRSLACIKEALGERHPSYSSGLTNLGVLHQTLGDHEAARPLLERAAALREKTLGVRHLAHASALNNLAMLHKAKGAWEEARALFERAVGVYEGGGWRTHPDHAATLNSLALLHKEMGEDAAALALSEKALGMARHNLRAASAALSDRQQLEAAGRLRVFLDCRLSVDAAGGHVHVLAWKGAVLQRQRQRRLFAALSAGPRTREAAEGLRRVTRRLAALSASASPSAEGLKALTDEQERLQAELAGRSEEARAAFKEGPPDVSAALPDGAVLVDYVVYWRHAAKVKGGERRLLAFVCRKGGPTARIELGPASAVEEAVRRWRPALMRGGADAGPAGAVKRLIWTPLEKHVGGVKVVLVSPDGILGTVPFAALPGSKEGTYLIEDKAIAVVPVPALLATPDRAARPAPSLLCVGGVDYEGGIGGEAGEDARLAPPGARRVWEALPATAKEAASARASFAAAFKEAAVADLSKGEATKKAVREALARVRYAHLATHGFFAPETLKIAGTGKRPDGYFGREGVGGWHPLLLSGLACAGANREPKEGEEDGILTALEVSEMDLSKLDLAVLSACETGLGREAGGEGLLGLQRAFAVAGARSVVASLWSVDDAATRLLMGDFYRHAWDAKKEVALAEALRRAQLAMLNGKAEGGAVRGVGLKPEAIAEMKKGARVPPSYWAAWVLSGDWR